MNESPEGTVQSRLLKMIIFGKTVIIIIIILFQSGNKAHKRKQETYRQTDRQYK